ncbi:MAG TPA: hypothetical protein ENH41_05860 [Candidatus Omnitrophica bacterium]|nr:hypothetical protein [Candidatus Omnitrophota bacterium]
MAFEFNRNFDISFLLSKQKIILFILTVVLSLLFAVGVYKNQKQEVQKLEKKIKEEKELNEIVDDIKLQEKEFTEYLVEFSEKDPAFIVEEISGFARGSGIKISSLAPQKKIDSDIFSILSFDVKVEGLYHRIGDFLSRLESSPAILHVIEINLYKAVISRKKRTKRRRKTVEGRDDILTADIVISVAFIKE